jgi:hypothetical protein
MPVAKKTRSARGRAAAAGQKDQDASVAGRSIQERAVAALDRLLVSRQLPEAIAALRGLKAEMEMEN